MKNDRSGKCETNLNAKCESARSGKCEKRSTLNVKKKFGQLHDHSDGQQFGQFGQPGQFSRHFRVSGCQHSKR